MSKKKGLGRGLNALLGGAGRESLDDINLEEPQIYAEGADSSGLKMLAIDQIQRGKYQPRVSFDQESLEELAESIKQQGMLQPILVRAIAEGYEIIAGERRWRAAQLAEIHEIPALIKEYSDEDTAAVSLIENIQRQDLNPLEEARALNRLLDEFGMTHQSVAESIGRSRAAVTNSLRLLDLSDQVKQMLERAELGMGHARALLSLDDKLQVELANKIVAKDLSVRATEALVKAQKDGAEKKSKSPKNVETKDADIQALESRLSDTLGSLVGIKHKSSGSGKVEINYSSLDELEGILSHIN